MRCRERERTHVHGFVCCSAVWHQPPPDEEAATWASDCKHAQTHTHTHTHRNTHTHTHTHTHTPPHTHTYTQAHPHVRTHTRTQLINTNVFIWLKFSVAGKQISK